MYAPSGGDEPAEWGAIAFNGVLIPVGPALRSGRWYRVRLQILPDGRCGLALDGVALAISDQRFPLDRAYHAVLEGNSAGNRMLVGPVEVWEGVRPGVDWSEQTLSGVTR